MMFASSMGFSPELRFLR